MVSEHAVRVWSILFHSESTPENSEGKTAVEDIGKIGLGFFLLPLISLVLCASAPLNGLFSGSFPLK